MVAPISSGGRLDGFVAAITGGVGSIGSATARALTREGAEVYVLDLPQAGAAQARSAAPGTGKFIPVDVSDGLALSKAIEEVTAASGRLDIAVGCAGVASPAPLEDITDDDFDRILAVNLRGSFNLLKAAASAMRAQKSGKIVLLGSVAGHQGGVKSGPHYVSSKAGVHGLARWAAKNLGPHNVYVNAVAPGPVITQMWAGLNEGKAVEDATDYPLGRLGRPEDVAEAIVFLSSPASNWITGITLDVNGGYYFS